MTTTLIISSYSAPEVLRKTLTGYAQQTTLPEEILIANDDETGGLEAVVSEFAGRLPIRMLTQAHQGFGKCRILNRAMREACGEYLIFSDQDCIPRRDFVATHLQAARPGHFVSGGCYRLTQNVTAQVTEELIGSGSVFTLSTLRGLGQPLCKGDMKLIANATLRRLWDALTPAAASWNGCNGSAYRSDLMAVGGYDERMTYGGADRELGSRLENLGIKGMQYRHRAILLHQWHERPYKTDTGLAANRSIRRETERTKAVYTPYGVLGVRD